MKINLSMSLATYQKINNQLDRARLKNSGQDEGYVWALFISYIIFMGTFYFINIAPVNNIYLYLLLPVALLPLEWRLKFIYGFYFPMPQSLSLYNLLRNFNTCGTSLAAALFIYITNKAVLTYIFPEVDSTQIYILGGSFFPLALYFVINIRLCVDMPNFFQKYFYLMGPVVAINAAVNIYEFLFSLPDFTSFQDVRMSPSFGCGVNTHSATSSALTYAIHFFGLTATLSKNTSKIFKYVFLICLFTLMSAIILTQARGTFIGLILAILLVFILSSDKKKSILLFGSIMVGIIPLFLLSKIRSFAFARGDNNRLEIWTGFLEIIKKQSIFGHGDRDFMQGSLFEIVISNGEHIHHAHNILLNALWRGGLVGLISLVYILVFGIYRSVIYLKKKSDGSPLGLLLILIIAGMVDIEFHITPVAWLWTTAWLPLLFGVGADAKLRMIE